MLDDDEADDDELLEDSFVQARFPIRLDLPEANSDSLDDAKEAIRREFRDSVKWKRLPQCQSSFRDRDRHCFHS